jgi:L-ribulose-5-phosphate 4-epimerase
MSTVTAGKRDAAAAGPSEQTLRGQVAACTLLLNDLGLLGYSGHVSARLPGQDAIVIQSRDLPRSQLGPDDLLICDFDGKLLEGPVGVRPPSEIFLHTEIMRARPDVNSVAHFHHDRTTVFTMVATLGKAHALLIRAHGQVIAAESVPAVLVDSATFIENAEAMILATQLGRVLPLTEAEIADFRESLHRDHFVSKAWEYYVALGRKRGALPEDWDL